jgi:uncharacterized protein
MLSRLILTKLLSERSKPFVSVLIGPRQVGKTTLLKQIEAATGEPTSYLDAENPLDALTLRDGFRSLTSEIGLAPQTLLIDEFQRIPDALSLFKQLRDGAPQIKVYASGSSSIRIHEHLKQSAVGRVRRTRVFPLSFPEWLRGRDEHDLAGWDPLRPLPPRTAARHADHLARFVVWGGMPELTHADDEREQREILHEIVALYLEKDIRSLLAVDKAVRFNAFLRLIANRVGQLVNRSALGRELGMSARQTDKQLEIMQGTFVITLCSTDYANPTKRLVKAPKLSFYDNGVRNELVRDFRPMEHRSDAGALLENHVVGELDKARGVDIDLLTHRTADGQEIDVILERDRQKIAVEVKTTLARARVPRALREFVAREDCLGGVVLNREVHELVQVEGKPVLLLPHTLTHAIPSLFEVWGARGPGEAYGILGDLGLRTDDVLVEMRGEDEA